MIPACSVLPVCNASLSTLGYYFSTHNIIPLASILEKIPPLNLKKLCFERPTPPTPRIKEWDRIGEVLQPRRFSPLTELVFSPRTNRMNILRSRFERIFLYSRSVEFGLYDAQNPSRTGNLIIIIIHLNKPFDQRVLCNNSTCPPDGEPHKQCWPRSVQPDKHLSQHR